MLCPVLVFVFRWCAVDWEGALMLGNWETAGSEDVHPQAVKS